MYYYSYDHLSIYHKRARARTHTHTMSYGSISIHDSNVETDEHDIQPKTI